MIQRTKTTWILAASLGVVGLNVWPGCAYPRIPPTRRPISSLQRSDFDVVKGAHPTRGDILQSIGEPDVYFPDLRVAGYPLNRVRHRRVFLCFFVIPLNVWNDGDDTEMVLVQYDENDRALRCACRTTVEVPAQVRALAWRWANHQPDTAQEPKAN